MREVRKVVFGGCCAIGSLAGLWSAMWTTTDLGALMARFGTGLAAGTAAGLVISLTVLRPRTP